MQATETKVSPQELQAVVQFIKTLAPRFEKQAAPPCISIPEAPALSDDSIKDGKQIYRLLQCWKCHGKSGRGDGPAARELKDDWGQPIKAYNFVLMKKFKCGGDDRDLYRTLHTGMSGSPMPSYTEAFQFTRESIADMTPFEAYFGRRDAQELAEYLRQQPDAAPLRAMTEAARRALVEKRTWALIHYLRSL